MASEPTVTVEVQGVTTRRAPVILQAPRAKSRIHRVLLVEDNPVNQELALAMLLELGVGAVSAWSGEEALVKIAAEHFDAILMDCQMPKLDGYATTRRLREWERRTGRDRTPIIAVTANALNGDAARCFEAGMDRYLSKPFTMEQLYLILESCVPDAGEGTVDAGDAPPPEAPNPVPGKSSRELAHSGDGAAANLPAPSPAPDAPGGQVAPVAPVEAATLDERTLDRIRDLHRRGGPNLLGKMAELYVSSSRTLLAEARKAYAVRDAARIAQATHALKSSSSSIGATLLSDLLQGIESAARSRELDGVEPLLERAVAEHARVLRALESLGAAA
jgi:CheY-like chemotaxis protein